jgi:PKD repeat protein
MTPEDIFIIFISLNRLFRVGEGIRLFGKTASGMMLTLLLAGMLTLTFNIQPTRSAGAPDLTVFEPEINKSTVSVNGVVFPGNLGSYIQRIHWNWGDGTEEDQWFPASHIYAKSGNYTITVTAHQSDGLTSTKTRKVSIEIPPTPPPTVLLLVNGNIYPQIRSRLSVFEQDLGNEGYHVMNVTVHEETSPSEIKNVIISYYHSAENLVGAILIGNVRAAYSEICTGDYSNPNALKIWISLDAVDMYYMDMDGYWENVTRLDFYAHKPPNVVEVHLYPSCQDFYNEYIVYPNETRKWDYGQIENRTQYKAEIWVSRIMAHNLKVIGKNETDMINEFFDWDHSYRTGVYDVSSKAYILCSGSGYNEQGMDYSKMFDNVIKKENVTKNDFITCLGDLNGSKLTYLTAHSWPHGHALYDVSLGVDELDKKNKTSIFYILNACSACRWDQYVTSPTNPNYLGGLYVFDTEKTSNNHGLGVIGFTGVGGFNFLKYFTDCLNSNPETTYGEAYKYWFNNNLMHLFGVNNYVYLGDPTIGPKHPKIIVHDVAIIGINPYRTILGSNTSTCINVSVQNEGATAETFNIVLYCNLSQIETQTITLPAHQSKVLTFRWTPAQIGNYEIKAVAEALQNENDITNNIFIYSTVIVSISGDLNADAIVNIIDISIVAIAFGTRPGDRNWIPVADLDENKEINIIDISIVARNFGKTV